MKLEVVSPITFRDTETGNYYARWSRDGNRVLLIPLVETETLPVETPAETQVA